MPYFETIEKISEGSIHRLADFSFIAENMILSVEYVKRLISMIESNEHLAGDVFWKKIIYAINPDDLPNSGFSEFETYGNFMMTFYPNQVLIRKLRTLREAVSILGNNLSNEKLLWASKDYDIISIETSGRKKTLMAVLAGSRFIREHIRMKNLVDFRVRLRSVYRKLIGKDDFQFD